MSNYTYVVVYGDLVQGFIFNGPYATRDDAELAAGDSSSATIARLWEPTKATPYDAD